MTATWPLTPNPSYYLDSNWLQSGYNRNGVFYVGDTIVIPRTPNYPVTDPATADFETGTNGATIATTDRGSFTPFSNVFGSPVYDNTHAVSGSLSMKIGGALSGNNNVSYNKSIPQDGKTHVGRMFLYVTANPSTNQQIASVSPRVTVDPCIISVNATGKIVFNRPLHGGTGFTFTNAIPLNQWCRLEWKFVQDTSAGSITARLYQNAGDTSPLEEKSSTGLSLADVSVNGYTTGFGGTGVWGSDWWVDDVATNASDWIGSGTVTFPTLTHDYEVRDFWGNIVSSGSFDEYECRPTAPAGGWPPGWYRVYFTGDQTDANYGPSYGTTQFCVLRDDGHFPTMPSGDTFGGWDSASDLVMKGVMGLGTSRLPLSDLSNLDNTTYPMAHLLADVAISAAYWTDPGVDFLDPNRARYLWCNVPGQGVDRIVASNGVGSQAWGNFYCKDATVDGSQTFVAIDNGTSSGKRIRVYSPDSSTLVETYDNITDATTLATDTATSSYIRFFTINGGTPTNFAVTAIGRTYYNNLVTAVGELYTAGVTHFEGPTNEPNMSLNYFHWIHEMMLFQAAVHAGNASAKAIGPGTVDIYTSTLTNFFANGGGDYCDELSFHAYNSVDGDIHIGKANLSALETLLTTYTEDSKPRWQTESTQGSSSIFVHVPHKNARWFMWNVLMLEQYGFPRERNNPWYDKSHGFWSFDTFLRTSDGAVTPQAVLGRVLAEETWGKPFDSAVDFGDPGNDIFIGNLYVNGTDGTSVIVVLPTSAMSNGSVTFTISGTTDPLTAVDGFGNESTLAISGGKVSIPVTELPSYLELPNGATATVASCNDWNSSSLTTVSLSTATVGGTSTAKPIDGLFMVKYDGSDGNAYRSPNSPPEDLTVMFTASSSVDRVILWGGFPWQNHCAMVKFDVQTTTNGTDWVTQKTVDHSAECATFNFGAGTQNTGTTYESYYPEPWVFDVSFDAVTATGVRIYVYQTTYGGMPDAQSNGPSQDNGVWQPQHLTVQEVKAFTSSSSPPPATSIFADVGAVSIF